MAFARSQCRTDRQRRRAFAPPTMRIDGAARSPCRTLRSSRPGDEHRHDQKCIRRDGCFRDQRPGFRACQGRDRTSRTAHRIGDDLQCPAASGCPPSI